MRNHFKTFQIVSKDGRESRREGYGTGLLGYACSPVSAQRGWVGETLSYSLGKNDINSLPDLVGNPMKTSHQPSNWLNPAAFAIPTNAQIAAGDFFGNEGIGTCRSPGLSIFKNFAIREGTNLQFRSEFFNLMNTPFFGQPGSVGLTVGTSTFGKVTTAGPPRIVQLALKLLF